MPRLALDFRKPSSASPWPARVLVLAALAFAADVGLSYADLSGAVQQNTAKLARLRAQAAPRPAAPPVSPEEAALARDTVDRLGLPWETLFSALESAASADIALSGIAPDARAGTVSITGEAKNYLAALGYVLNLSRDKRLADVKLMHYESRSADPQSPVSFAVSAAWSASR